MYLLIKKNILKFDSAVLLTSKIDLSLDMFLIGPIQHYLANAILPDKHPAHHLDWQYCLMRHLSLQPIYIMLHIYLCR